MARNLWGRAALLVVSIGLLPCTSAAAAQGDDGAVVSAWNGILQSTLPPTAGLQTPRYYSMMHVAMFDAVNAIEQQYTPFRSKLRAPRGASTEAAAAQAAHDVLAALFPANVAIYDQTLAAQLTGIPPGTSILGRLVGKKVAAEILAWRFEDGWHLPPLTYELPPFPGQYQRTPPNFPAPGATQYPGVKPFALLTATQFLPSVPPTLNSAAYAEDYNEVKEIGKVDSATRLPEQTQLAQLFAGVITPTSLFALWSNVARDVSADQGLSLVDTARLFALMHVSINDGLQTSQTSKFIFGLWRPVTAIQRGGEDLNDATAPDAEWLPLLSTPPYPSYAGNMACVGASAATALALGLGTNDVSFNAVWRNTSGPDYVRPYTGFWEMAVDQANSRVYGGIHFRFDNEASQIVCPKVAQYAFSQYMKPRR